MWLVLLAEGGSVMSADWIAVWGALAAVPIVLLLCFTGCVLDRHGLAPANPAFTFPAGLNLHLLKLTVTMTIVGVDDTPPAQTKFFNSAVDIPADAGTLYFAGIDASTVNTSPSFDGDGEIGPFLTLTCECKFTLEGDPTPVSLSLPHTGDDADSLNLQFTLAVAGNGTLRGDYSLS
jgi:hypothetical protein